MAVAILLIGVGVGLCASVALWLGGASLILVALAYPLGGMLGCVLAGLGVALCRSRSQAASLTPAHR